MIVSVNQPAYLPWLGYFDRIASSDLHVVLDHVQFEKNSFVNRNRIMSASGPQWLTVPVKTKGRFGNLPICELEIDNQLPWRRKHWRTMRQCYAHAPYFEEHAEFFAGVYEKPWKFLVDLCRVTTDHLLDALAIDTRRVYSSAGQTHGHRDEMLLDLCRSFGATDYLSGALGEQYLDQSIFKDAQINVMFQDYQHPHYPQIHGRSFESNLSIVDLLFNCGSNSRQILLGCQSVSQDPQ